MIQASEVVTSREAHVALLEHGKAIEEDLRETFSPPILDAFYRIGDVVCSTNTALLEQATSFHPVQEAPYTAVPPDFLVELGDQYQLPRGQRDTKTRLREYWPRRDCHDQSSHGILTRYSRNDVALHLQTALVSMDGVLGMDSNTWEKYTQNHIAEHKRDFCTLPYLATDYAARRYPSSDNEFATLERQLIDEHLTYVYPTMLEQATGSLYRLSQTVAFPLSSELRTQNSGYAERLLRAAAFIIEALEVDEVFREDIARVTASHYDLVDQFMLRSRDHPQDVLGSGLRSTQESIGRAVLPLVAELLRGHETNAPTIAALIAKQNIAARVTRLAPLGYIGPVGQQGVGTTEALTRITQNKKIALNQAPRAAFAAMNDRWRTEFHYPRLTAYLQATADGNPSARRYERTGLMCPFATPFRYSETGMASPGAVAEATKLLITLAELMPEHPATPRYDRDNPYRPWDALPLVYRVVTGSRALGYSNSLKKVST